MGKTSKGNSKTLLIIGNSLMLLSIISLLIIFFPIIKEEIKFRTNNVNLESPISEKFSVRITSLKINAPVIQDVDPWNKNLYLQSLLNGVAHAKGTALPNQAGTTFLFAHSSDVPWRITSYNTAFYRLGKIQPGDQITITYEGEDYFYQVRDKKVVWPIEVEFLTKQGKDQLILQTCTPIGTSLKRLLVFAEKV